LKALVKASPEVQAALIKYAPEVQNALKAVVDVAGPTTKAAADSLVAALSEYQEQGYLSVGSVKLRAGMPLTELSPQLAEELMKVAQQVTDANGGEALLSSLSTTATDGGAAAAETYLKAVGTGVTKGLQATGKVLETTVLPAIGSGLDSAIEAASADASFASFAAQTKALKAQAQGAFSQAKDAVAKAQVEASALQTQAKDLKVKADAAAADAKVKLDEVSASIEALKAKQAADREAALAAGR
jgi:hypothetical protein